MIPIAVLCVSRKSAYHGMPGVEVFDSARDARTFQGGMCCIAHPPCRAWSIYCRHQAKPDEGEKELGLWVAEQVKREGGILEQPARSLLWKAADLPIPGAPFRRDFWSMEVWQSWWGYRQQKRTWLFFSKIEPVDVHIPFTLRTPGQDKRIWKVMSKKQISATIAAFAEWLVDTARKAKR